MIIFRKRVAGLSSPALARFVKQACAAAGVRGGVNVLVTGSRELRALNNRFRKRDLTTDVLSFPPMPGLLNEFAGDVAISAEIAKWNARRLGHSAADEIKILVLHGILHLAGHDHEHDRGQMARKEMQLRALFSLPDGLIERSKKLVGNEGGRLPSAKVSAGVRESVGEARPKQSRRASRGTPPQ